MHLEVSAILSLGLLMYFEEKDSRNISKIELTIKNPDGLDLSFFSEKAYKYASAEADLTLNGIRFRAAIQLEEEYWDEFIMTFFLDESPKILEGESIYKYDNKYAFNAAEICRMQFYGEIPEES